MEGSGHMPPTPPLQATAVSSSLRPPADDAAAPLPDAAAADPHDVAEATPPDAADAEPPDAADADPPDTSEAASPPASKIDIAQGLASGSGIRIPCSRCKSRAHKQLQQYVASSLS